mgnify:FL=1
METARFFYFYDTTGEHRRPAITICRLQANDGCYGYGWAICPINKNPCKRYARNVASGKAKSALQHRRWAKPRLMGEQEAWLFCPEICRAEAITRLKDCGVIKNSMVHPRLSRFSTLHFFDLLPTAMQPIEENIDPHIFPDVLEDIKD